MIRFPALVMSLLLLLLTRSVTNAFSDQMTDNISKCRTLIPSTICEVGPPKTAKDRFSLNRECINGDVSRYNQMMIQAFDAFPAFLKARMCRVKRIYIEDEFMGAAWSAPIDEKKPTEFLIGLRKAELDANLDLGPGRSWFEQQTFGNHIPYKVDSNLPQLEVKGPRKLTATEFTLIHELGHTLDYEHEYSKSKSDPLFSQSWTAISWNDIQDIKSDFDFPNRKSICLNHCNGKFIDPKLADAFYKSLFDHGFISQLSATNAMEDFADSFAFYVAINYFYASFKIKNNRKTSDLSSLIKNKSFELKRKYIQNVVQNTLILPSP